MLQHLAQGRVDLMVGRGSTGPVYPWFGQDIRQGLALALENYNLLQQAAFYGNGFFANHIFWPKEHYSTCA